MRDSDRIDAQETEQAAVSAALGRSAAEQQHFEIGCSRKRQSCTARQPPRIAASAAFSAGKIGRRQARQPPKPNRQAASQTSISMTSRPCFPNWPAVSSGFARGKGTSKRRKPCGRRASGIGRRTQTLCRRAAAAGRSDCKRRSASSPRFKLMPPASLEHSSRRSHRGPNISSDAAPPSINSAPRCFWHQRETLELRLATDELWRQMVGAPPPAALSQSLAQIRGKLAERYRLERSEIAGEKKDLELLVERVDRERERVQQQKQEIERRTANRQADIEGQADAIGRPRAAARRAGKRNGTSSVSIATIGKPTSAKSAGC